MAYAEVSGHHGSAKACVAVSSQRNYYYYLVLRNTRQASFRRHKTGKAGLDILARSGTRAPCPFTRGSSARADSINKKFAFGWAGTLAWPDKAIHGPMEHPTGVGIARGVCF